MDFGLKYLRMNNLIKKLKRRDQFWKRTRNITKYTIIIAVLFILHGFWYLIFTKPVKYQLTKGIITHARLVRQATMGGLLTGPAVKKIFIRYEYSVNGNTYRSNSEQVYSLDSKFKNKEFLSRHVVGRETPVYYNPTKVNISLIYAYEHSKKDIKSCGLLQIGIGIALILFTLFIFKLSLDYDKKQYGELAR